LYAKCCSDKTRKGCGKNNSGYVFYFHSIAWKFATIPPLSNTACERDASRGCWTILVNNNFSPEGSLLLGKLDFNAEPPWDPS